MLQESQAIREKKKKNQFVEWLEQFWSGGWAIGLLLPTICIAYSVPLTAYRLLVPERMGRHLLELEPCPRGGSGALGWSKVAVNCDFFLPRYSTRGCLLG